MLPQAVENPVWQTLLFISYLLRALSMSIDLDTRLRGPRRPPYQLSCRMSRQGLLLAGRLVQILPVGTAWKGVVVPKKGLAFAALEPAARRHPRKSAASERTPSRSQHGQQQLTGRVTILNPSTPPSLTHLSISSATFSGVPTQVAPSPPTMMCSARDFFVHFPPGTY